MDAIITEEHLEAFRQGLLRQEKSPATLEKYLRDVRAFWRYTGGRGVGKELVMAYKSHLQQAGYAPRSINSMLASVNSFLASQGWEDCRVRTLKLQKPAYCPEEQELTREEYRRLLDAANLRPRLRLVMQTICATGIRVSELRYFTVENVTAGEVVVSCKGKTRVILVPGKLRKRLLAYIRREKIETGVIFRTRRGTPLDRRTIWAEMKALCGTAGLVRAKVFPHNLRKLFARSFYALDKDIAKLADILGHSSIDTTRIYIITTGSEHRKKIERLGLVV